MVNPDPKGVGTRYKIWRSRFFAEGPVADQLREAYHHDTSAYFRAFPRKEETERYKEDVVLCEGMAYFTRLVMKPSKTRYESWRRRGEVALTDFTSAIMEAVEVGTDRKPGGVNQKIPDDADFVFLSVDFEGDPRQRGVTEFGVAKLDAREFFTDTAEIETSNYAFANYKKNFRFGQTIRSIGAHLRETVLSILNEHQDRKVLLIAHGISYGENELAILEHLDLAVDNFKHIVGTVDTAYSSLSGVGYKSLQHLLTCLRIPYENGTLHCGGNDAHYTLCALLALLHKRCCKMQGHDTANYRLCRMQELAKQPVPSASRHEGCEVEDWADSLDGRSSLMMV